LLAGYRNQLTLLNAIGQSDPKWQLRRKQGSIEVWSRLALERGELIIEPNDHAATPHLSELGVGHPGK
jgi:hypothetical protein